MYLTFFSIISTITNIVFFIYIKKQKNLNKELQIKLKITRDFADVHAEKELVRVNKKNNAATAEKLALALKSEKSTQAITKSVETMVVDSIEPIVKKPRRRKKKTNNAQQ